MSHWPLLVYFLYGLATVINTFAALSLPYAPAPYTYIAEIQFNEKWFNGSVNGMPVQNLAILRLGNWAACYYDSQASGVCLQAAIAYKVTITEDNSTRTIVQPLWTAGLIIQAFAFLATFFTLFHARYSNCYWVELSAVMLTLIATLPDVLLFLLVKNEMQTLGEVIVTSTGPAFSLIAVATLCLCGGAILRYYFAKKNGKAADGKALDGKAANMAKVTYFSGPSLNTAVLGGQLPQNVSGGQPSAPSSVPRGGQLSQIVNGGQPSVPRSASVPRGRSSEPLVRGPRDSDHSQDSYYNLLREERRNP